MQPFTTKWSRYTVVCHSEEEYRALRDDVFRHQSYFLDDDKLANPDRPVIIDLGAHTGLTTLFFNFHFPTARIFAVEPMATNLKLLEQTIWENQLEHNVEIIPKAVIPTSESSESESENPSQGTTLHADTANQWFSTASVHQGSWQGDQKSQPITVSAMSTQQLIQTVLEKTNQDTIDILKIDIEGAEQAILQDLEPFLPQIKNIMFEFHPHPSQNLHLLVLFLEKHYQDISFWKNGKPVGERQARGLTIVKCS